MIAWAVNRFSGDVFGRLAKDEKRNIFFSPLSLWMALAMAAEGARGQTAQEMQDVLHLPKDLVRRAGLRIDTPSDALYELNVANALWMEEGCEISGDYLRVIEEIYQGLGAKVPFKDAPEASRKMINDWVQERTGGRIKDLVPSNAIDSLTKLILTDAVYFKGLWEIPFDKQKTRRQKFKTVTGNEVDVMMMRPRYFEDWNYFEDENLQMVQLPYAGGRIAMDLVLPKDGRMAAVEAALAGGHDQWRTMSKKTELDLSLPSFTFEQSYELGKTLVDMGMNAAFSGAADFDGQADFSGITGEKDLYIGAVIHRAFVEVNEAGTEAAAATALVVPAGAMFTKVHRPVFQADHPFLFLIRDLSTGCILFVGRLSEPSIAKTAGH